MEEKIIIRPEPNRKPTPPANIAFITNRNTFMPGT